MCTHRTIKKNKQNIKSKISKVLPNHAFYTTLFLQNIFQLDSIGENHVWEYLFPRLNLLPVPGYAIYDSNLCAYFKY